MFFYLNFKTESHSLIANSLMFTLSTFNKVPCRRSSALIINDMIDLLMSWFPEWRPWTWKMKVSKHRKGRVVKYRCESKIFLSRITAKKNPSGYWLGSSFHIPLTTFKEIQCTYFWILSQFSLHCLLLLNTFLFFPFMLLYLSLTNFLNVLKRIFFFFL